MANKHRVVKPDIGEWYQDAESSEKFRVVDIDDENDSLEIQYFDGTIGELSRDDWEERPLIAIEAPEDWTGPMESLEEGDVNYDEESFELPPKHTPLSGYEQDELLQLDEASPREEIPGSDADN